MRGLSIPPKNVDDYLAAIPAEMRPALEQLRKVIRSAAPKADEVISYQLPAFKYQGSPWCRSGTEPSMSKARR